MAHTFCSEVLESAEVLNIKQFMLIHLWQYYPTSFAFLAVLEGEVPHIRFSIPSGAFST
jgi:ribonuclease BN (tRNA processing enzyme)